MKKIAILASGVLMAFAFASCNSSRPDITKLDSAADSLSYAIGLTYADEMGQLIRNAYVIDSTNVAEFIDGVYEGLSLKDNKKESARYAGLNLGHTIVTSIIPTINEAQFGDGVTSSVSKEIILDVFQKVVLGQPVTMTLEHATELQTTYNARTGVLDSLNYAVGVVLGHQALEFDFIKEKCKVDEEFIPDFLRGIEEVRTQNIDSYYGARISGVQFAQSVFENDVKEFNKTYVGSDTSHVVDPDVMLAAFAHGLKNAPALLTLDEAMEVKQAALEQVRANTFADVKAEGEQFLADNGKKDSIQTTASGLQYKVLTQGKGDKPAATDVVRVNYEGRLVDGTVFDSSFQRGEPAEFPLNGVIAGWTEALQLMSVGSEWEIYLPYNLAYGSNGAGGRIPPYSALIFKVQLLDIVK